MKFRLVLWRINHWKLFNAKSFSWWLSIRSDDDVCILQLIYEHGGGSAAPVQRHRVLNNGGTGSQLLWSLLRLLCSVSLWQQWVSGIEPLRSWQQVCEPSLAILVCSWHILPGLSDWCGTTGDWLWPCLYTAVLVYLGFFCLAWSSPYIRRLSIWHSSIRITCPTHQSWALMMVASMQVDLARLRNFRLVMWSCHLIPRMEWRARMWKSYSFLICLRYSLHVSQP